jgi:hypothetical protein
MSADYLSDDLKSLWQELGTNPVRISLDELQREAGKLKQGLRKRSFIGLTAALVVIAAFSAFFFVFPNKLQRIGSAFTVLGAAYIVLQLRMRRAEFVPNAGETECVRFYRAELERQRDFHRGRWFWSRLVIFFPGPLIFLVGFAQAHPELATFIWLELATFLILAIIAVPLNLRLARRYQHRIDALDALQKGS